jgi:hypothetical protein
MNVIASNSVAEDNSNPLAADVSHSTQGYRAQEQPRESLGFSPHQSEEHPQNDSAAGNIDKIRDIIFGSQMRDYEYRFVRLEEALKKESSDLRETTRRDLEALESFVHKEIAALESRMNTERDERTENHSRMAADLSATSTSILKKIGEVENQEAQAKREIRNDLLQQSKELSDAIRRNVEELEALLDRRVQELQHAKTDRAGLANLFSEVALRLTDQFKMPGAD